MTERFEAVGIIDLVNEAIEAARYEAATMPGEGAEFVAKILAAVEHLERGVLLLQDAAAMLPRTGYGEEDIPSAIQPHGAMKKFRLRADAEFDATEIDDAFRRLAAHFTALKEGGESDLFTGGSIEIEPCTATR